MAIMILCHSKNTSKYLKYIVCKTFSLSNDPKVCETHLNMPFSFFFQQYSSMYSSNLHDGTFLNKKMNSVHATAAFSYRLCLGSCLEFGCLNVSWGITKCARIVLKRPAFPAEYSVPLPIVYVDNPQYASKKSTDSPGIDTFLY